MIMPVGAESFSKAVQIGAEIFHTLKGLLNDAGYSTAVGDEGGFAPSINSTNEALDFVMKSIEKAGFKPGEDVVLALDAASTEFYKNGIYNLEGEGKQLDTDEMIAYWHGLIKKYPIISIEDPLDEDDWDGYEKMTSQLGDTLQIVGDDLYVTNPKRLSRGISEEAGNAILIKVNQIGSVN